MPGVTGIKIKNVPDITKYLMVYKLYTVQVINLRYLVVFNCLKSHKNSDVYSKNNKTVLLRRYWAYYFLHAVLFVILTPIILNLIRFKVYLCL